METRQRQTAFKVRISEILNGRYFVQEGWEPNYIIVNGNRVSRVNMIGVIVSKQSNELGQNETLVLDDGTGRIQVRSFGESDFSKVKIGDVVLLIGRPREYGNEIYVVPEIIRPIENRQWVDVRKTELESGRPMGPEEAPESAAEGASGGAVLESVDDGDESSNTSDEEEEKSGSGDLSPAERIIECIKEHDKGGGADFEDVVKAFGGENVENLLSGLLKRGDIFELKPGKLKILE